MTYCSDCGDVMVNGDYCWCTLPRPALEHPPKAPDCLDDQQCRWLETLLGMPTDSILTAYPHRPPGHFQVTYRITLRVVVDMVEVTGVVSP